jgi:hypothetical protein
VIRVSEELCYSSVDVTEFVIERYLAKIKKKERSRDVDVATIDARTRRKVEIN